MWSTCPVMIISLQPGRSLDAVSKANFNPSQWHSRQFKGSFMSGKIGISFPSFWRRGGDAKRNRGGWLLNHVNSFFVIKISLYLFQLILWNAKLFSEFIKLCLKVYWYFSCPQTFVLNNIPIIWIFHDQFNQPPRPGNEICKYQIINRPGHPSFKSYSLYTFYYTNK